MFETSNSMRLKQRLPGSAASVLLHGALAIILFTIAVPGAVERRFSSARLYFPGSAPTVARPETTQPFKRVIVPMFAPPKPAKMLLPRPLKFLAMEAELALPEAPAVPVLPTPPVTLSLLSPSFVPPPSIAHERDNPRKPALVGQPIVAAAGFQPALSSLDVPTRPLLAHATAAGGAFGDGAAIVAPPAQRREIASTQFDAVAVKSAPRANQPRAGSGMRSPLEITSKPRPLYTDEARRLRIEGEVLLQVIFRASSEICVLRVIRGLGHGLDENAISAAAAIRFRPATEDGRPIDDVATVRITFQLAD
jgi:TonB family protein